MANKKKKKDKKPSEYERERVEKRKEKEREAELAAKGGRFEYQPKTGVRGVLSKLSTGAMSVAVILGVVTFIYNMYFGTNNAMSYLAVGLMVLGAIEKGWREFVNLGVGLVVAVILWRLHGMNIFMITAFIWALFYIGMFLVGLFSSYRK